MNHAKTLLILGSILLVSAVATGQEARREANQLTAEDRLEIQQLIFRYGHAIDTCANNGYDYADLYTEDGEFVDAFSDQGFASGGMVRAKGREQLARTARAGQDSCEGLPWAHWSHLMINPVITPTSDGAHGETYLVVIGEQGPDHVQRFGGYEDEYVKTVAGWRIARRTHVRNRAWSHPLLQTEDLN